jgi:hypothetical protein
VQAQDYLGALWALGQRVPGADEATIERALAQRRIVRSWPLRGTLHLVAADDLRWLLDLTAPRMLQKSRRRLKDEFDLDDRVVERARSVCEHALADLARALGDTLVEVELVLQPAPALLQRARRGQVEQPAQVVGRDEVQGATQRPAADDASLRECTFDRRLVGAGDALAERPQRAEVVLCLHGKLCSDGLLGRGEACADEMLAAQARAEQVETASLHGTGSRRIGARTIASSRRSSIVA